MSNFRLFIVVYGEAQRLKSSLMSSADGHTGGTDARMLRAVPLTVRRAVVCLVVWLMPYLHGPSGPTFDFGGVPSTSCPNYEVDQGGPL